MRKILLALSLAASIAGCSKSDTAQAGPSESKKDEVPAMTVDEVDREVAAKQVQAVDCNHDQLRKKLGVVPGAILVSSSSDYPASILPADKAAKLVFYCADPG
jgi:ABC-type Fe3+-citrate transport system substrate-binding protein